MIEDDDSVRGLLSICLSRRGAEVIEVQDVIEATKVLNKEKIDLIVTDLFMPRLNGFEFIKYVKTNPIKRVIPVLVVSGASQEQLNLALDCGADKVLQKPIKSAALNGAVDFLMRYKEK